MANDDIKYHQELVKKWNDPKDIAQRAASLIIKIHQYYAKTALTTLRLVENNCNHPKKMRDLCADGTVYCMSCNQDLREKEIMSKKTSIYIKKTIQQRRKLVKKFTKKLSTIQISMKLGVSLATIEKDLLVLKK